MSASSGVSGGSPRVAELIERIRPATAAEPSAVQRHLDSLTKPPGSLGELESVALRLAMIYGDPPPSFESRVVFVLAADHGVASQAVSAYPREVTAEMCRNYARGGAAVCTIARSVGADVVAVDVGVDADLSAVTGLVHAKVRRGTRDLASEPALRAAEVNAAILVGAGLVSGRVRGPTLVGLGEMGIGNTTAASAIATALTGAPLDRLVGPGTGVGLAGMARKRAAIEAGLGRLDGSADPFEVLAEVGGLEIAGLVGVALGAAGLRQAVVTDGFIATAAALLATRMCPAVRGYLVAAHCGAEPGHRVLLEALGLRPIFELGMRLGEGTGAALAFPVLGAAGALLREMATFEAAGVSGPRAEVP